MILSLSCHRTSGDKVPINKAPHLLKTTYFIPNDNQAREDIEFLLNTELNVEGVFDNNRDLYSRMTIWPGIYSSHFISHCLDKNTIYNKTEGVLKLIYILERHNIKNPHDARAVVELCVRFLNNEHVNGIERIKNNGELEYLTKLDRIRRIFQELLKKYN
jgi:hypothetical protein